MSRILLALFALAFGALAPAVASAQAKTVCAYDPAGRSGEFMRIMQDYKLKASTWGVELDVRTYTDEETAAKDYEAGKCDGVVATGVRLQRFNRFSSSIEAIGAITEYEVLKQLVDSFVRYPSAAQKLRSGEHETVGVLPAGLVFLFVRDRNVDTVAELAGKRIATMDYDKAAPVMVNRVGAIMVPADLGTFGPMFNNGNVDSCYMSAIGYRPFELWRGMDSGGGVIDLPLAMATIQVMVRHDKFPADFGAKSREWFAGQFERARGAVMKDQQGIAEKYWVRIPAASRPGFDDLFLQSRLELRDKHKAYDGSMLSVLRRIRCARDAARSECAEQKE
jgi:hypothetical protein